MNYDRMIDAINKAKSVAVISHISPDGDTVGSALALYRAMKMYGKQPYIFCDDTPKGKLRVMKGVEEYTVANSSKYDLAIAVDCGDLQRLGECAGVFNSAKQRVVIDHHKTNERFGDINLVDPSACATAQMMYFVLAKMNLIDDEIAKLLYTGLVTDSGGFTYSSVSSDTFAVASQLIEYDIDASRICEHFLSTIQKNVFLLKNRVLSKAKFYDDDTIGIISFLREDFEETDTDDSKTDGIVNEIRNVDGVKVAVSISEIADKRYKVSFRSSDMVDCSRIAMVFGGGGHKNAAGCRVSGFYEDVVDKLLKAVRDEIC